jgi:hypothetical protein
MGPDNTNAAPLPVVLDMVVVVVVGGRWVGGGWVVVGGGGWAVVVLVHSIFSTIQKSLVG